MLKNKLKMLNNVLENFSGNPRPLKNCVIEILFSFYGHVFVNSLTI